MYQVRKRYEKSHEILVPLNGRWTFGLRHLSQKRPFEQNERCVYAHKKGTYDDDEEIDDLPRVALNIQDEGVRNTRRRTKDDNDLQMRSLGKHT